MTITVPACQQLCELPGNAIDWYADKGPRLMTWIIPVALSLSNIELSPLDKRRFYTLLQALGNPIDVLWSFDPQAQRPNKIARPGPEPSVLLLPTNPELAAADSSKFIDIPTYLFPDSEQVMNLWKATALELADSRTDEQLRSLFAVVLYWGFYVSEVVFEDYEKVCEGCEVCQGAGHGWKRSLQNDEAVRRLFARVMIVDEPPLAATVTGSTVHGPGNDDDRPENWKSYFKNLHWRGGKDTYRPWKMRGRGLQQQQQLNSSFGGSPKSSAYLSATSLGPTCTHAATTASGPPPPPPSTHFLVLDCDDTEHNT
ncbi:hypothetical protein V8F33_008887 [Rhypophila sp. PSN 637]